MLLTVMIYVDDPGFGGNAVYAHHLSLALADAGVRVVYVHFPNDSAAIARREERGIRHVHLSYDTIGQHFHAILDRREPERILIQERPDVVLFSDSVPQSTAAAKEVAAALGIPAIAVKHLVLSDNKWATPGFTRDAVNRSLAASRLVVTVSHENADTLARLFTVDPARLSAVYNSVPARFFTPRDEGARRTLRAEWGVSDDTMVVFTTARVLPQKGYDLQARVLARLARDGRLSGMLFVWAGEIESACWGEVEAVLDADGTRPFVRMLGRRSDIDRCLDATDAFFLPSRGEGMPLSVIEAMAKAVPVIATAVSGIPEAVGETGRLLPDPNTDTDAMVVEAAAALAAWRDAPAERAGRGRSAAERARTLFRPERQLGDMLALFAMAMTTPDEYVSSGLRLVCPDRHFPYVHRFDPTILGMPADRSGGRHARRVDARRPYIPLPNRDEGALIYNTALRVQGRRMLVVGCGCGWTAAHVRAVSGSLDIVDPTLVDEVVRDAVVTVFERIPTGPGRYTAGLPGGIPTLRGQEDRPWSLLVLDADALGEASLTALEVVLPYLGSDAFVLLIGAVRPEAGPALSRLAATGWSVRAYDTGRVLAVAWRGNVVPVPHVPDPAVTWDRPAHLADYLPSGCFSTDGQGA